MRIEVHLTPKITGSISQGALLDIDSSSNDRLISTIVMKIFAVRGMQLDISAFTIECKVEHCRPTACKARLRFRGLETGLYIQNKGSFGHLASHPRFLSDD